MSTSLKPPAANAIAHGLTAQKYLPANLAATVAQYREALFAELRPTSILQEILVAELARHGAAIQLANAMEAAAMSAAQQNATALVTLATVQADDAPYLAAAMSETVERAARYRRHHERSFFAALTQFREVASAGSPSRLPELFQTDDDCVHYLLKWQMKTKWQCAHCESSKRNALYGR